MPSRCIFCSEKHLTDEDIWPRWFKTWLQRKELNTKFQLTRIRGDQETVLHAGSQSVGGKRRIMCQKCNNRRFAPLQEQASRIMKPMLDYSWAPVPRDDIVLVWPDQEVLASWATMTAMAAEFLPFPMPDNDETFFTQDDRIKFRRTHKPFKRMVVEASYYFGDRTTGVHFTQPRPSILSSTGVPTGIFADLYVVTINLWQVVLQLAFYRHPDLTFARNGVVNLAVRDLSEATMRLWPRTTLAVTKQCWPPQKALDDESFLLYCNRWKVLD